MSDNCEGDSKPPSQIVASKASQVTTGLSEIGACNVYCLVPNVCIHYINVESKYNMVFKRKAVRMNDDVPPS